jgi:hypothetical protein
MNTPRKLLLSLLRFLQLMNELLFCPIVVFHAIFLTNKAEFRAIVMAYCFCNFERLYPCELFTRAEYERVIVLARMSGKVSFSLLSVYKTMNSGARKILPPAGRKANNGERIGRAIADPAFNVWFS